MSDHKWVNKQLSGGNFADIKSRNSINMVIIQMHKYEVIRKIASKRSFSKLACI